MQDASLDRVPEIALPVSRRLAMLLMGYIPLLHAAGCAALFFLPQSLAIRVAAFLFALYVLPPLVARITLAAAPLAPRVHGIHERGFLVWWWTQQWQTLFNRLPLLEEILRLVPSLYSAWLRLWGARVGALVYWGPGVAILDRPLTIVGDQAMFGAGVRMAAHLVNRLPGGAVEVTIAPVTVGSASIVGAYSLLGPGVTIGDGESTPAALPMPPHSEWRGNRRVARRRNAL